MPAPRTRYSAPMKRAVIYARVSTERQADEGVSMDSQIDACRRKAAELDAAVVQVYRDDGISGTTDARPGFRQAITHCTAMRIDYLLCWSSSRFARDQHDAITYKRELASAGVRLVYASSGVDVTTNEGWLADSFSQIIDEHYSRQVAADTRRSMMSAAADGFFMGGRVPYGYQAVPVPGSTRRRLQPHPAEAGVVQTMFAHSARGIGAFAIAVMLNEQGITHRGKPWQKNAVLHMLKSEVYMGQVIYNRFARKTRRPRPAAEWIRVQAHQALVTPDTFAAVQTGLSDRTPSEGFTPGNAQHTFAGLLRCAACGSGLKLATGTGRGKKIYSYYACNGDLQGKACGTLKRLPAEKFDAWMLAELLDRVLTEENVQGVIDQMDGAATRWVKDRAARRTALVAELRGAESRRSKLFEVLEVQGKDAPGIQEMAPRLRDLNEQCRRLEVALVALEDEQQPLVGQIGVSAEEAARVMRQMVNECEDAKTLRGFVASIVERIVVSEAEVRVEYHPECLIRVDGAAVRSTVNWLPVHGLLRTAVMVIARPGAPFRRPAEIRAA